MWNSPNKETASGTRYKINEIAPLINAIGLALDGYLRKGQIDDSFALSREPSLSSLNLGQYVYSVFRTCNSLLDENPAPRPTPPPFEAILRDMLRFLYDQVRAELSCGTWTAGEGNGWMQDTWRLYRFSQRGHSIQMPSQPRMEAISSANWEKIIFEYIASEFLADTSGLKSPLLLQEDPVRCQFKNPHAMNSDLTMDEPTLSEFMMANHYLLYLVWAAETASPDIQQTSWRAVGG